MGNRNNEPIVQNREKYQFKNYRPITLLNIAYKIFSNILHERLRPKVNQIVGDYEAGFITERGTTDHIFIIRQFLEKTQENNITTFHLFIDFKAAYDSMNTSLLYEASYMFGIHNKLVHLIIATMAHKRNSISSEFVLKNDLRQMDEHACLLFNLALEKVVRSKYQRYNIFQIDSNFGLR